MTKLDATVVSKTLRVRHDEDAIDTKKNHYVLVENVSNSGCIANSSMSRKP